MAQFPKATYVRAIDMKCAECIYDPIGGPGTWREQVEACTSYTCPIYPIRPLPEGKKHPENPVIPNLVKQRREECRGVPPGMEGSG